MTTAGATAVTAMIVLGACLVALMASVDGRGRIMHPVARALVWGLFTTACLLGAASAWMTVP